MKILKGILVMICLSLFVYANEDDKYNTQVNTNLYDLVILKDVKKAINDINDLSQALKNKDDKKTKDLFTDFVQSWKSVETFYILGDLNEEFIDTPRYMDIFHNANEDIKVQLDRAIKSNEEARVALFKNSLKSINALEYILFTKDIKNQRVNDLAIYISKKLSSHLDDILNEYENQRASFIKNQKKSNAIIINAIIQNSYKLKEWRIGDVSGLSKKYKDDANNKRAEYFISKNSASAIEAVLLTYKNVLDNPAYEEFGDYLLTLTDGKEMTKLRVALLKSLDLVKQIKNDDFSNTKELYKQVDIIHVVLFVEMIEDLQINSKILDADGD
ncbi:MAG: imelysin family protein [Poseidonibacter sp.]|uniref:imelysin family protein n=1 Tax=Poseidonibacter sp. TaxID=2321188 RepID=UPI00359E0B64